MPKEAPNKSIRPELVPQGDFLRGVEGQSREKQGLRKAQPERNGMTLHSLKIVCLAFTGASGMPYGIRLLECLLKAGCQVQLIYSQVAQVVAKQEMALDL